MALALKSRNYRWVVVMLCNCIKGQEKQQTRMEFIDCTNLRHVKGREFEVRSRHYGSWGVL